MKKLLLLGLTAVLMLASSELWAQEREISGTVTSADDGAPIPGVNIVVKGTTNGTVTDGKGAYHLTVPAEGGTLVFTFIGLQTAEVEIGARTTVDVQMAADVRQLSEVVVTALGIEKTKNELAYAAQKIEGEQISRTRDNNFINALSGKVSGLDIKRPNSMGGSTNVVIRGSKSLTGNNQALFVVDGVPIDNSNTNGINQATGRGGYDYGNAAADINPDDIESINVLKGAAATALYGSRASNGVVLITTKKGRAKKGVGVSLNAGWSVGKVDKSTFAEYQNKYGEGYGAYYEDASGFFLERDVNGDGTLDLVTPVSEDASYGAPFDPSKSVYLWDAFDPASPNYLKPHPFTAAKNDPSTFFEDSHTSNYSVLLNSTGDKGYYKIGYTRNAEKGIVPKSSLQKDFFNFGGSYKITDKLTANASLNTSFVKGLGRYGSGYDDKNLMTNFRQWWATTTDIKDQKDAYFRNHKNVTWNWADPDDLTPIYWDNPYFTRYENFENDNRLRNWGYASLDYKITDWLNVMGRFSLDTYSEKQEERQALGSVTTSSYSRFNRNFKEYNYDLMANIDKDLSDDITLKAVLGTNIRRTSVESIFANTNGGLVVERWYSLSNSKNSINAPVETESTLGVDGYFASASLGLKKMVFVDLSARRDQASSLPVDNNAYFYPSASLGFVFSELVGPSPWLTGGKLRVNYAEVGNTAPPQSLDDYYAKPTGFGSVPLFSVPSVKNNPELKPERTKSFEVGLEMAFFDDRAGFDVTYYKQNTVDQIVPAPVSRATGYDAKYINAGNVENKGVELQVYATPVKTDDFFWRLNLNWTRNRNEVVSLGAPVSEGGIDNLQLGSYQGGVSINASLGQPYGTIRGSNFVYNDKGQKLVDTDGYYQVSATSNEIIGNINPDWIGGINNTLSFRNVSLSFLIDMKKGGDLFSLDMYYGLATGIYPESAGTNNLGNPIRDAVGDGGGWLFPGVKDDGSPNDVMVDASAENGYGTFGYAYNPAAAFVYDAGYIKLREVVLTYSLPQSVYSKIGSNGIDISLVGRNLWIIDKTLPYADPEDGLGSGNLAAGYQVGAYPNVRNIGFNLRFQF